MLDPFTNCSCLLAGLLWDAVGRVCSTGGGLAALYSGKQRAGGVVWDAATASRRKTQP